MSTYEVETIAREEIKLIGFSIIESLHNVIESRIVGELREKLEKRRIEIENRESSGIYLVQIYPDNGHWTP